MSYREAYHEAPSWEVQNLLDAHHAEIVALARQRDEQQIQQTHAEKLKRLGIEQ